MKATRSMAEAIRLAALVGLGATSLMGCGGRNSLDEGSTVGGHGDAGVDGSPSPTCALAPTPPGGPLGAGTCQLQYPLTGPSAGCDPGPGGVLDRARCDELCPSDPVTGNAPLACAVTDVVGPNGVPPTIGVINCQYQVCGVTGRRPVGLARARAPLGKPVARMLAELAHLEAASVDAFEILAAELDAHGAPAHLCDAARRAARDEIRHARAMTALATRAGARVSRPRVVRRPVRSLEAIARENATEGCVRETFGAVIAHMQSVRAEDAGVRAAMTPIARDEARHAALSWEVAAWLDGRLDEAARRRVARAQARAVAELTVQLRREPGAGTKGPLGLPSPNEASRAFAALRAAAGL